MKSLYRKEIVELFGGVLIVASLLLVAYELRQNSAIATAQAVSDNGGVIDASYRARAQNAVLDELIDNGHSAPDQLSEREKSQFFAWLRADMNGAEGIWFYYKQGLIPASDFDGYVASFCDRVTTPGGTQWWHTAAKFYAAGFRENIDSWCFPSATR
jgi:hypothetical protein